MDAESRWADNMEWKQERNELEVKIKYRCTWNEECMANCILKARMVYEVGLVFETGGATICLCDEHDDDETAFHVYERLIKNREV